MRILVFILVLFSYLNSVAQKDSLKFLADSNIKPQKLKTYKSHSPSKAAIMSALVPGLGQIYNKKYWKVPIVWGGLAGLGYLWINENNRYQNAKDIYLTYTDTISSNNLPLNGSYNVDIIQSTKNVYRNQRDMYLIFGILFYSLSIVDAAVDAHFMNFDVSDDLSMNWNIDLKPYTGNAAVPSLCLQFHLKK